MLARCSRCQTTFETDRFGLQRCPHCGTDVFIRDPSEPLPAIAQPPSNAAPPPPLPPPPTETRTPWERRGELGLWRALGQTLQLALGEPGKLYGTMRYDRAEGWFLYVLLVAALPALVGALWGGLSRSGTSELDQLSQMYRQMGQTDAAEAMDRLRPLLAATNSTAAAIAGIVLSPLGVFAVLYLAAGITHLWLLALGKAKGGWTGTFKACVYAASPGVIALLPICGGLIAGTWATGLQIVGLKHAHGTTTGMATTAVILFHLTVCFATCGAALVLGLGVFHLGDLLGGGGGITAP